MFVLGVWTIGFPTFDPFLALLQVDPNSPVMYHSSVSFIYLFILLFFLLTHQTEVIKGLLALEYNYTFKLCVLTQGLD